jgi:hypothetical protein
MSSILELVLTILGTSFEEICGDSTKRLRIHTAAQLPKDKIMKSLDDYFTAWEDVKKSNVGAKRLSKDL